MVKNVNDFSKWSYYNGQPAEGEIAKIFWSGEKYKDFSKWFYYNGRPVPGGKIRLTWRKNLARDVLKGWQDRT